MKKVQCAVIGIGGIGKWHGQMMQDTGEMKVAAVCDANPELRAVAKELFAGATFYTDAAEMLKTEKLDLVGVVVPHNLHAPLAIAALNAGANVIVEKPFATTYEDCLAVLKAARKNKRFATVFHNRRLDGWYLTAQSVIHEGLLGNVFELNVGINFRPGPETWRGWKEKSGGIMFDWGAHLVDYALHLADSEVETVSGFLWRSPDRDPALNEDHGSVRIHFASGAVANVVVSGADQAPVHRYRLLGDKGTLVDDWLWGENDKLTVYTRLSGGEQATMEVPYQKTVPQLYYDNLADHFRKGTPLMVSGESAARVIDVLTTAERSSLQGGVPLPLAG
jgi:predicted dehydrogenase